MLENLYLNTLMSFIIGKEDILLWGIYRLKNLRQSFINREIASTKLGTPHNLQFCNGMQNATKI